MKKVKSILQGFLIVVIVAVTGHILVSNIEHFIYINKQTYTYNFESSNEIKSIKSSLGKIEANIAKMDNLKNSYIPDEELNDIKTKLTNNVDRIKKLNIWNYNESNDVMNQVELFKLLEEVSKNSPILNTIDMYRTIAKYNDSLDIDKFIGMSFLLLVGDDGIASSLVNNYKYESDNINVDIASLNALIVMNNISVKVNVLEYISNLVIESGDSSE